MASHSDAEITVRSTTVREPRVIMLGMLVRKATIEDISRISALLVANGVDRGGALVGDWREPEIRRRIERRDLVLTAYEGEQLAGVLLTEEREQATAPRVLAMLRAWPGRADAYVYGPVCVDAAARGKGVLQKLYTKLMQERPGAEAILFIRRNNEQSLKAHLRLGLQEVARFEMSGEIYLVLSSQGD
jgi:ribosomal protein S18 acetylase RimI-like enzyme